MEKIILWDDCTLTFCKRASSFCKRISSLCERFFSFLQKAVLTCKIAR